MYLAKVTSREVPQLRRGGGPRSDRIEHESLSNRVPIGPLRVRRHHRELLRTGFGRRDQREKIIFTETLVHEHGLEDLRAWIEQKDLEQRTSTTPGGGDPLAKGELLHPHEELCVDRPSHRSWYLNVDRETDQVEPIEVVHELDRVSLRCLPVSHHSQPDAVEARQPRILRNLADELRSDIRIVESRERLVFRQCGKVLEEEVFESGARETVDARRHDVIIVETVHMTLVLATAAAAVASSVLVELARRISQRAGHYDHPNERSSHTRPTPRTGGTGIVLSVLGCLLALRLTNTLASSDALVALLAGAILVAAVSFLDDLRPLPASVRFSVHLLAALIVIYGAGHWSEIGLPNGYALPLGRLGIPFTCLWIVAVTNIYNFMDGIDGIAGAEAVVAGFSWAILGTISSAPLLGVTGGLLAGAALGFLAHNWPPARIFMGDAGSAFIGYLLAAIPLISPRREMLFLPAALILWPFLFDGTLTILRRLRHGENVFVAHRSHLYQRLNQAGRSHAFVTGLYIAMAMLGAVAAITMNILALAAVPAAAISYWLYVVRAEQRQRGNNPSSRNSRPMPSRNETGA
jgi:Fuc2NAc and GlcNAc transferase